MRRLVSGGLSLIRAAWLVFRKELLEARRDRRTIVLGLAVPILLMPAITLGLPYLAAREESRLREAPARVAVMGREHLTAFIDMAVTADWITVVETKDPEQALAGGEIDAILEARPTAQAQPTPPAQPTPQAQPVPSGEAPRPPGDQVVVRMTYDGRSVRSLLARQKLAEGFAQFTLETLRARLAAQGADIGALLPVQVEERNMAPAARAPAGPVGGALPFFITVWILLGGQYAALDLGAGERERGTLPALLVTPPSRTALVLGKFAAVLALASASVFVVVAAVQVTLWVTVQLGGAGRFPALPASGAATLLAASIPVIAALSAVQLLLSLTAKSVREAQMLFTPLYLLIVGGVVVAQVLPEWARRTWIYAIPGLNTGFLLQGASTGELSIASVALALSALGLTGALSLAAGAWIYGREPARIT